MIKSTYEHYDVSLCEADKDEFLSVLEKEPICVLATCADNRVTVRQVSYVSEGFYVYFQTDGTFLKVEQMRKNPNVALSIKTYDIEGKAEIIGHPLDEANKFFIEKCNKKHPGVVERYSSIPTEAVIKVEITSVRQWLYIGDKPFIAVSGFSTLGQ